ncbi:N-acetylmuramoyl-L-alanine amidase [Clostridium senegalense]
MVKSKLESLGQIVNRTRPINPNHTEQSSCQERANNANDWGADLFVSVHNNAGGGEGTEILTYGGEQTSLAKRYLKYILDHNGKTHDGILKHNSIPGEVKDGTGYIVIN